MLFQRKKITLLSTYFENIGDDLIRFGVMHLIRNAMGQAVVFSNVAKSNPLSIYFPLSRFSHGPMSSMVRPLRLLLLFVYHVFSRLPFVRYFDKVVNCDLFVVAGTPLFYFVEKFTFLHSNPWTKQVFEKRLQRVSRPRTISLGIGSIVSNDNLSLVAHKDAEVSFLRKFVDRNDFIITRDELTRDLLIQSVPFCHDKIYRSICPSLWGAKELGVKASHDAVTGRNVTISYSTESAGYSKNPAEAITARKSALIAIIKYLRTLKYIITLVAHNKNDYSVQTVVAKALNLKPPLLATAESMLRESGKSCLVITWRVHGALGALSIGVPTILFKTDNRYVIAEEMGARIADDSSLTTTQIQAMLNELLQNRVAISHSIHQLVELARLSHEQHLNRIFSEYLLCE